MRDFNKTLILPNKQIKKNIIEESKERENRINSATVWLNHLWVKKQNCAPARSQLKEFGGGVSEKPVWRGVCPSAVPHPKREKEQNSSRSSARSAARSLGALVLCATAVPVLGGRMRKAPTPRSSLSPPFFARAVFYAHADQPVPKSRLSDPPIKKSGA